MNTYDAMMIGKSAAALLALKEATDARLAEFLEVGNVEQSITYRRIQEAVERAIIQAAWDELQSVPSYVSRFAEGEDEAEPSVWQALSRTLSADMPESQYARETWGMPAEECFVAMETAMKNMYGEDE